MKALKYILILTIIYTVNLCSQWTVYTTSNSGLPSNDVGEVAFDTNNIKWIPTGNGLARFDGINWTVYDTANSPLPVPNIGDLAIDKNNVLWIGTGEGGVVKFDGLNWTIYDTNNSPIRSNSIRDIIIDIHNNKWFCTHRGIAKFDDVNWTLYNSTNSGLPENQTWCIAIEDTTKWIGMLNTGLVKYDNSNWSIYNFSNSGIPSNNIFDVTVDVFGNKWAATQFGGIAKFKSSANQWTVYNSTNSGLTNNNTTAIVTQNHIKWIGTGGLAMFNDTTWVIFDPTNSPLPSYSIRALSIDKIGKLWVPTSLGLALYDTGIIGINTQNQNVPRTFILHQNYPNPFNPETKIKYELNKAQLVNIKIYDAKGTLLTTLLNKKQTAGKYEINFNASRLPSGVYFYVLEADGFTDSKKMILLK